MSTTIEQAAEQRMAHLALQFELQTGNRIRWRDAPAGMAAILNLSLQSEKQELVDMAMEVLDALSAAMLNELMLRGLAFGNNKSVYRGASVAKDLDSGHRTSERTYRGVSGNAASGPGDAPAVPRKKSKRIYRGQVVED